MIDKFLKCDFFYQGISDNLTQLLYNDIKQPSIAFLDLKYHPLPNGYLIVVYYNHEKTGKRIFPNERCLDHPFGVIFYNREIN